MSEQIHQHKEELRIFRQVENSDLALKSQLIDVFDEIYFRGLRNRHTGFYGVSYFQMISHLYVNYGTITAVDLIENERRMDIPFDQSGGIETYFNQIEDAVEFAEAGASPFTTVQITTKAFIQMFPTGLFKDECKAWNRLPPVSRDWATFKLIFIAAARDLLKPARHHSPCCRSPPRHSSKCFPQASSRTNARRGTASHQSRVTGLPSN